MSDARLFGVRRTHATAWVLLALLACAARPGFAADDPPRATAAAVGWDAETIELAASLPVQEGGRLKPLSTLAETTLLAFSGRKHLQLADGTKRPATEWLLNLFFAPDVAARQPVFAIEDDAILDALGLAHENRKKRDWYSFAEVIPAQETLTRLRREYGQVPPASRGRVEDQVVKLYDAVARYIQLQDSMSFATVRLPVAELPELARFFPQTESVSWSTALAKIADLRAVLPAPGTTPAGDPTPEQEAVLRLLSAMNQHAPREGAPAMFPPARGSDKAGEGAWRSAGAVLEGAFVAGAVDPETLALLRRFEAVGAARGDTGATYRAVKALRDDVTARAEERGEYDRVPLEATYNRLNLVGRTLGILLTGFLLSLVWLFSRGGWSRLLGALSWLLVGGGGLALLVAITLRCVIRQRPPISNLYEVTLFIAATGVVSLLLLEAFLRQRLWLTLAAFLGALMLFVARGFEKLTAADTMPTLQPVLDTNFWLATHVTTVALGYTAGLVASAIAHVHVLGRAFGLGKERHAFYAGLTRATYGMICFGLLFSVVGTILGGIWANYSWGRFWGWDPKENGALMICLWELALLHARMGGYIGPHGIALAAIFGGVIVAFSYWHVNLLGVGLHSYGFTAGIWDNLLKFYCIEAGILAAGFLTWWLQRPRAQAA
jgi:ABC-type transport system involved in cytochrome c biogenesis permease subunit